MTSETTTAPASLDTAGLYGPDSMLRRLCHEARWGLAVARATVLEAAHPQIGAALIANSTFVAHPWRRLRNTVLSAQRLVDPDERVRRREAARLNRLHARMAGTDAEGRPYTALDPGARAWVVATLFESTVTMYRLGGRSLDGASLDRLYAEFRLFLAHMEGGEGELPPTLREFWRYYDLMVEERLENTEAAALILHRLFAEVPAPPVLRDRPAVWAAGRALAAPLATAVTVGSLPAPLRERLGLAEIPGARTLTHAAYLSTGLASRLLPDAWTRLETVMAMFDPTFTPRPGTDPFAGLRRGTAKAGALLRLLTPDRETAAEAPPSAVRFFAEVLDQTGNGYLDWPDLAAMAREIATRLDLDERGEDRLFTAFADWWRELQAALDTDHDGRISGHEYAAAAATMTSPALVRVAEVLFDATDTDDDQAIDAEEHRTLFRVAFEHDPGDTGTPDRLTRAAFVREFLNFMAGRHHSEGYDRLFAQA
ncbi:oxygenase MpaB family protein [Actinoallomurus iriomotensis]|uniref:EF-hand domain-containing protein n=1 Tax=Actinoallomurus iriomotensis TaxID=478107 RepID=A0A9W6RYE6_9ACTN|nr:oxygenase MpaB family protein [Actinoallomurus iriomotensis]GLY84420.1 hypothetical protein Airi02_023490 [Actinoallomurus iriomotensis]